MIRQGPRAHSQRGVALLIALLVVALATILIASLLDRGELAAARTRNQLRTAQAQAYAQGLEIYAARVLQQAYDASGGGADSSSSVWAVPLPNTPVPGGEIAATMRDRNGCFNLNNLVDANGRANPPWPDKFKRLLTALKLDPKLADAAVNWMNPQPTTDDAYYLAQPVPYRPAKRGFVHVSELRLVKGVTGDIYAALAPHVCALPPGTKININTATVPVLMTVSNTITEESAQRLWQEGHANFPTLGDAQNMLPGLQMDCGPPPMPAAQCYSVSSTYFLARGDITLDGLPFTFFSLIERNLGGTGVTAGGIRVIERSRGADD